MTRTGNSFSSDFVSVVKASAVLGIAALVLGSTPPALFGSSANAPTFRVLERPPLFEEHPGLPGSDGGYLARTGAYWTFLTEGGVTWSQGNRTVERQSKDSDEAKHPRTIRMEFAGSNTGIHPAGELPLAGQTTYIRGGEPGPIAVRNFGRARYRDIYPGIDLVFRGVPNGLEFDFVLAPDADPNLIRLRIAGADNVRLSPSGDLILESELITVTQSPPQIFQMVEGMREEVPGRFVLVENGLVGFEVDPTWDRSQALVIDPVLGFSSYWGGSAGDVPAAVAVDSQGNLYVAGSTGSGDFPLKDPFQEEFAGGGTPNGDLFVTKLDPTGRSVIYSTYIGGAGTDIARGLAVDQNGRAVITGTTFSDDFPATPGAFQTVCSGQCPFVVRLSADGSQLSYSTFVGRGDGSAVAVDSTGTTVITGRTSSSDFPVANAFQQDRAGGWDAFLARLSSDGSGILFSTYLGGSGDENLSGRQDIALDSSGNVYVTGRTSSSDFPTLSPVQATLQGGTDAYIAKFTSGGSLVHSSYLGGTGNDGGQGVVADQEGSTYLTGNTLSPDFPVVDSLQSTFGGGIAIGDAFVSKIAPQGGNLAFSTYLGGSGGDTGADIALDDLGRVVVTGNGSANFPTADPFRAFDGIKNYLLKLTPDGSQIVYSTPIGGGDADVSVATFGTKAYVAGNISTGTLPILNALQPRSNGSTDGYLVEVSDAGRLYFAQLGNGTEGAVSAVSEILLTNSSEASPSRALIQIQKDDGSPFALNLTVIGESATPQQYPQTSELEVTVPPLGAIRISTDGAGEVLTGWVRVDFDNPLGGVVRFNLNPAGTAGVGTSELVRGFITPVRKQAVRAGIAVANPQDSQIGLTLRLRGMDGQQVSGGLKTLALAGGEHLAQFIDELFPNADLSNFEGTITVTTSSLNALMIATALELGPNPGQFTTLPVTPIP